MLHIVGRTAIVGVGATLLIELSQSGLNKGGGGTKEGHHPHPENGTWTSNEYSGSDTGKITCSYPTRERDGKSLKRADTTQIVVSSGDRRG